MSDSGSMMNDDIVINGVSIAPGEDKQVDIPIEELPTHTLIEMPVHVIRAEKPGPRLLLTAALHGDEINGTEIIRRMIRNKSIRPEAGTVIAMPVVNIYAFLARSRALPDGKDMNRSFPGSPKGSIGRRLANTLMREVLPHADLGIDLHTGGASRTNFPQIRFVQEDPELAKLARAFGAPFLIHSGFISKSFRKAAAKEGKRILVYEGGESMRLDEFVIEHGIQGIRRVMHYLGMVFDSEPAGESLLLPHRSWLRAKISGIFRPLVQSGDAVKKSQPLGTLADPFGETEVLVKAPRNAWIIGLNNDPVVHAGFPLFHIAWE